MLARLADDDVEDRMRTAQLYGQTSKFWEYYFELALRSMSR